MEAVPRPVAPCPADHAIFDRIGWHPTEDATPGCPFHSISKLTNRFQVAMWDERKDRLHKEVVYGEGVDALREAISIRNALCKALPFRAKYIAIDHPRTEDDATRSNTGYMRIYRVPTKKGERVDLHYRCPETGGVRKARFPFATSRNPISYEAAIDKALRMRRQTNAAVIPVIDAYNRLAKEAFMVLARREWEDLEPRIQRLQCFDPERWARARALAGDCP
ncbi:MULTISPECIES: hypothetical protein [unclassified Thioalkalivibrio]|uniref:hypothetical protein n=1 Tax=unclassified Thioalkalivibrio TaxID=2621013 RepID=UPI00035FD949|nr:MULTISPECIES: hypothetical protein [unclassified Thioalkalivibrio]